MDNKKVKVLTGVNGKLNRFLSDVENAFRNNEFKSSHELHIELEKYLRDNIVKYVYFESVNIESKKRRSLMNPLNEETNWSIPVSWEVASIVNVKAKTIEEAYNKVKNDEMIPLPDDSFYIDGSFRTTYDEADIQLVKELYNNKDGEYDD